MMRRLENGSVLIVVLWACLGLVSISLLFGHSMLMTYRGADNDVSAHQAEQAIEGMARYAQTLMRNVTVPASFPDVTLYEREAVVIGEATAWFIGRAENAAVGVNSERVYGLVDETAKLNLNSATVEMLVGLPGMTDEFAAAIVDWRDADDEVTANGAESETYLRLQPGYACKNAPFESIQELALVNGATREILYGEDANLNGVLDANEDDGERNFPPDNSDGKLDGGVMEYVTAFSKEPLLDPAGTARINLSVPPLPPALQAKVEEVLGATVWQEIQPRLGAGPFQSVLQFYLRSELTPENFEKLAPFLTTSTAEAPANVVNVNTASEAVLASLPTLGADRASAIVAARASRTPQDTSIDWLRQALGDDVLTASANLTLWTYQLSADVAAVGRHGRGYRRTRFVIDNTTGTPRVVYRRNLAPLGWALGAQARLNLAAGKERR
ncbi:MAG TPA: hypothetical protein VF593_05155 [Chthoniobacteraceae bacterium]|jgi:type II secretory pathway component PulK